MEKWPCCDRMGTPIPDGFFHVLQGPLSLFELVAGLLGSWWGREGGQRCPHTRQGVAQTGLIPPAPGLALGEDRAQEDPLGLASCQADPTTPPRLSALEGAGPGLLGPCWFLACQGRHKQQPPQGGRRAPRLVWRCRLPQAPEAPSGWPGVPWACLGQPQVPARSKRGLFLGPLHLLATGRGPSLPGSALTVDEGLRLLIIMKAMEKNPLPAPPGC